MTHYPKFWAWGVKIGSKMPRKLLYFPKQKSYNADFWFTYPQFPTRVMAFSKTFNETLSKSLGLQAKIGFKMPQIDIMMDADFLPGEFITAIFWKPSITH